MAGWFHTVRSTLSRWIAPAGPAEDRQKALVQFPQRQRPLYDDDPAAKRRQEERDALRAGLQGKGGYGWASDHREESEQYKGWVAVAVATLVNSVGESTLKVMRAEDPNDDDGDQDFDLRPVPHNHPLRKLLRRPNPAYGWDGLIKRIVLQRALTGSAFLWLVPGENDPDGPPVEIYCIPTALVQYAPPTSAAQEGGYRVAASAILSIFGGFSGRGLLAQGGWHTIGARYMLRLSHLHPLTEMDGLSQVSASRVQIDVATQTEEMIWSVLENGAFPAAIASMAPGAVGSADQMQAMLDSMLESIERSYSGANRAGKILPLYGVSLEKFALSLVEACPPEVRTQNRDAVLAIFRTPATAAGLGDGGSYSANHAARQNYLDIAVQPELTDVASMLTRLLAERFGENLIVQIEAKPVNDLEQKDKRVERMTNSQLYTVDECRSEDGKPPHPDPEWGKLPPGAVVAWAQAKFAPQQPGTGGPAGGGSPAPVQVDGGQVADDPQADPSAGPGGLRFPGVPDPMRRRMPVHSLDELAAYRAKGLGGDPLAGHPVLDILAGPSRNGKH